MIAGTVGGVAGRLLLGETLLFAELGPPVLEPDLFVGGQNVRVYERGARGGWGGDNYGEIKIAGA